MQHYNKPCPLTGIAEGEAISDLAAQVFKGQCKYGLTSVYRGLPKGLPTFPMMSGTGLRYSLPVIILG